MTKKDNSFDYRKIPSHQKYINMTKKDNSFEYRKIPSSKIYKYDKKR
jgi:hypothetical protein